MVTSTANINTMLDKISSAISAAKRANILIDSTFQGDIFSCVALKENINFVIDLSKVNANIKLNALLTNIYCVTPSEQAMNETYLVSERQANILNLVQELQALSIVAPSHVIDVTVSVSGFVNQIMIMVTTNCSKEMYMNRKLPKPVIHVNFNISDLEAKEYLVNAISTVKSLMKEHKEQNKDAA